MSFEPPTEEVANMKLENGSGDENCRSPNSTTPTPGAQPQSFEDSFKAFSKFGDPKSDGKLITLSQSDKWMKQAKVIDGKKVTTTDTAIHFKKLKAMKINITDYNKFLEDLAKSKKIDIGDIKNKMTSCGPPGHHGVGTPKTPSTVNRLTDTSKYTGIHKQRFDQEGKGKGISGRKDLVDESGYVTGYQNKDTYSGN